MVVTGGWFKNLDANANGIFDTSSNPPLIQIPHNLRSGNPNSKRNYRTIDFSANILKKELVI